MPSTIALRGEAKALAEMQEVAQEWIDTLPDLKRPSMVLRAPAIARVLVLVPPRDRDDILDVIYEHDLDSTKKLNTLDRFLRASYSVTEIRVAYDTRTETTSSHETGLPLSTVLALQRLFTDCVNTNSIVDLLHELRSWMILDNLEHTLWLEKNYALAIVAKFAIEHSAHAGATSIDELLRYLESQSDHGFRDFDELDD